MHTKNVEELFVIVIESWTLFCDFYLSKKDVFFTCRVMKQHLREARAQVVDFLILGLAGVCLGMLAKVRDETFGMEGYTYTVIAVCKLVMHLLLFLKYDC